MRSYSASSSGRNTFLVAGTRRSSAGPSLSPGLDFRQMSKQIAELVDPLHQAVLERVAEEDVRDGNADHGADAEVAQGPGRKLTRRLAAEIAPDDQDLSGPRSAANAWARSPRVPGADRCKARPALRRFPARPRGRARSCRTSFSASFVDPVYRLGRRPPPRHVYTVDW